MKIFLEKKTVSVYQDFYATIYQGNLLAFEVKESDAFILKKDASKTLRYTRKTNYSRAISKIRDVFLYLVSISNEEELMNALEKLIKNIARYPVSIVPERSYPRKNPRKKRFCQTRRSVLSV